MASGQHGGSLPQLESLISTVGQVIGLCRGPRESMAKSIHSRCVSLGWGALREELRKNHRRTGGQEEQEGELGLFLVVMRLFLSSCLNTPTSHRRHVRRYGGQCHTASLRTWSKSTSQIEQKNAKEAKGFIP